MKACYIDALSAMFDGENVDPAILREALTDPGAPDWLVDFAAWRSEFQQDSSRPRDEFYRSMARILRPSRLRRLLGRPRINLPVAAALALGTAAIGFAIRPAVERPTPPLQTIQAASPNLRPSPPLVAMQPSAQARTPDAVSVEQTRTEVAILKARRMRFDGWRESRISE
jgi:hypothetical protein